MKFLVLGAGAIGGTTAAYMTRAGHDVTVLCRSEGTAAALRDSGMRVSGIRGDQRIPLHAVAGTERLTSGFDCCIVATKAYDTMDAVRSVLPLLTQAGIVLVLQNGVCTDELLQTAGAHRAACGVTSYSSTMLAPDHMELTGEGTFRIGMAAGGADARLMPIREAMCAMAPTEISPAILEDMYAKLIINSGVTCGGALTGQLLGQMLRTKAAREFFIALVYEDMALAKKMGIRVPPFGGKLDYYRFIAGNGFADRLRRHMTLFAVGLKYRRLKSSSLTSLERGKRTEVDVLNGWISRKAKQYSVPTPVNDKLVLLIREIEAGIRKSSPDNLREIM